jgi:hypothetical protein
MNLSLKASNLASLMLAAAALGLAGWSFVEQRGLRERTLPYDIKRTMAWKQYYLNKSWHAAQATDREAARWYLRQVERLAEAIVEADLRDSNGPLGPMVQGALLPHFEPAYTAIETADVPQRSAALVKVAEACNACHVGTRHESIRIRLGAPGLPWPQSFDLPASASEPPR